jgi:molecular chaperone GrpE
MTENGADGVSESNSESEETGDVETGDEATETTGQADSSASGQEAAEAAAGAEPDGEPEIGADLLERVEESDAEALANEISSLRLRVETLESDLDEREVRIQDLESKLKRKQADFQNYKKRMEQRREEEQQRATEDLVERLLEVRDNLVRALDQDENTDIRDGIEQTKETFDRILGEENVTPIEPDPGTEVDPKRHEVLQQVPSDRPAGTIEDVYRPGYEMADKVLRAAQVTVSDDS